MKGDAVRPVGSFAAQAAGFGVAASAGPLEREVASVGAAAVEQARRRLTLRLPAAATASAQRYFADASVHAWQRQRRPEIDAGELLGAICASPRSVAVSAKAEGLQVELRTLGQALDLRDLGDPVEPGSDVAVLSPERLRAAAARNASIELRQFDRQCPSWAAFADDVTSVTGADVFLKLFVADGARSVNGWHRDRSDVLVTVVSGAKRFAVAAAVAADDETEPLSVVDTVLRPGDALTLPRARLHCATPAGELSALLSIGLMRVGDWPYRQVPPTHLGFTGYPRSAAVYRLCLRSHVPAAPPGASIWTGVRLRTRSPGGIAVLACNAGDVAFVSAGIVYQTSEAVMRTLACVHAADGISADDVAAAVGLSGKRCRLILTELTSTGLVRV